MRIELSKQLLFHMSNALTKVGIEHFLIFGTLLGAIREKNLIQHDKDIDIGVIGKPFRDFDVWYALLEELNKHSIRVNKVWYDYAVVNFRSHENCSLDVYGFQRRGNKYWVELFVKKRGYDKKYFDTLDEIKVFGRKFKVPHNVEEWLDYHYGKDWKNPKQKFTPGWGKVHKRFVTRQIYTISIPFGGDYSIKRDRHESSGS